MAHVIPPLRTTFHAAYTPPLARRQSSLAANTTSAAKTADFGAVLKNQSSPLQTAVSNPKPGAGTSPANTSQLLSSSFLRNRTPRATSAVPPAGGEADTAVVSNPSASSTVASGSSSPVKVLASSPSQVQSPQVATPAAAATTAAPTYFAGTNIPAENPFGTDPYLANPTQNVFAANDGSANMIQQPLAAYYFPTRQTAQTVAQLFGGTVFTETDLSGNPFTLNQPRYMVRLANGTEINPGIIAHFYETRSDTPFQLRDLVQDVLNGGTMATLQPNYGGYAPAVHGAT